MRKVSVEIGAKYFASAEIFDANRKASYVLKLDAKPDLTAAPVFSVVMKGTLYTATGRKIWSGTKHAETPAAAYADEHAFHNIYAVSIKQLLDEIFLRKYDDIQTTANLHAAQIIDFSSPQEKLNVFATGTGFFVNDNGFVATNNHVVENCLAVSVMHDGKEFSATPVSNDKDSDLAIIKINTNGNDYARILPSDKNVRLGTNILTLGYPLEGIVSSSVNLTTGNVSALSGPPKSKNLIQITAPVQPGNSGGPVVDTVGTVVGMVQGKLNAFKLARHTGDIAQNVNFAVRVAPLRNLLSESGTHFVESSADAGPSLDTSDIAEKSAKYTVQLRCKG